MPANSPTSTGRKSVRPDLSAPSCVASRMHAAAEALRRDMVSAHSSSTSAALPSQRAFPSRVTFTNYRNRSGDIFGPPVGVAAGGAAVTSISISVRKDLRASSTPLS